MVPGNLPDELLDALPFLVVQVGDPFAGLVLELREKPVTYSTVCRCCSGSRQATP